jgi:hypothetical protein
VVAPLPYAEIAARYAALPSVCFIYVLFYMQPDFCTSHFRLILYLIPLLLLMHLLLHYLMQKLLHNMLRYLMYGYISIY